LKIRQSLALRFTLVSASLTGAILIFIYMLTRGFVHADFVERLTQQASLEALHYATPDAKNVLPPGSFLLANPQVSIFNADGMLLHTQGNYKISKEWLTLLQQNNVFNTERGEYTTIGRRYDLNGHQYFVFVSDKDLPGQHELDLLIKGIIAGWVVSLMLSYFAGLYFSGKALQPVNRVVKEVNHITKDNLSFRLQIDKDPSQVDEIDEMILTFNALLNRIESAFITQKRFVQHASHELKTPLTSIMAESELALTRDRSVEEYKRTLKVITAEAERLVTITQGLLTLARLEEQPSHAEFQNVNIDTLIEKAIENFKLYHPGREVQVQSDKPSGYVYGNLQLLEIALLNLLDNAGKYSSDKIKVKIFHEDKQVLIDVEDYGIGIPAHEINRLRSPMFRGSNVRNIKGAGLGLSLVDRILQVHHGSLEINSQEGEGTNCTIRLPLVKEN
jgi:signal transduction histidine kinase